MRVVRLELTNRRIWRSVLVLPLVLLALAFQACSLHYRPKSPLLSPTELHAHKASYRICTYNLRITSALRYCCAKEARLEPRGIEPRQPPCKSGTLPLHHGPKLERRDYRRPYKQFPTCFLISLRPLVQCFTKTSPLHVRIIKYAISRGASKEFTSNSLI